MHRALLYSIPTQNYYIISNKRNIKKLINYNIKLTICFIINLLLLNNKSFAQDIDTLAWEEIVDMSDTVYKSGMDTIYVIEDSTEETTIFRTGPSLDCMENPSTISINLNSTVKTINRGQFGINISGMFTQSTLYGDTYSADQWQWLSDLQPKVLRFPSGSNGKFMHLLTADKGYGYDIVEITRYLDAIDNVLEAPNNAADILVASDATALAWFGGVEEIKSAFDTYKLDYNYQEQLTSGDRYIDQFIQLIKKIETENPGHKVDVLVCLNILTETAANCKAITDYLKTNTEHSVQVAGVEMGNETANTFHEKIMKFNDFNDYWNYLDGATVVGQDTKEEAIDEALFIPAADRNFFLTFKNSASYNVKIGLCADGFNDALEHVFITAPGDVVSSRGANTWNEDLYAHYNDSHIGGLPLTNKKFHAVILHTYYSAQSWYDETITANGILNEYTCPEWDFVNKDIRIQPAFISARSNFKNFMVNRYDDDMEAFNALLYFNLTTVKRKELWITEWNFKDEGTPDNGKIFTNSFTQGILLQEWWMKNLKLNFTTGFRENFFKYATLQNFAGGSGLLLLTPADEEVELAILGKNYSPYTLLSGDPDKRNYYVKRTSMYVMELISEITKNNLNYFPASIAIGSHNPNMPPTFFITPSKGEVYMYFSNSSCNAQRFVINPSGMSTLYGNAVALTNATIFAVDAQMAYSQSGKSILYDFNTCYDPITNPYTIEIDQTYTTINPGCTAAEGSLCVSVPGYTTGYVKMNVVPAFPLKEAQLEANRVTIFPNPATTILTITATHPIVQVEIYTVTGTKMSTTKTATNTIDITTLTSGMYQVVCILTNGIRTTNSLIKL